ALAVTLTGLAFQTNSRFRIVISDQSMPSRAAEDGVITAARRVLESQGHPVTLLEHLPRRGMAEQRQFLLDQATAPMALFLDDDLILEPYVVALLVRTLREQRCGFVGSACIGLSYVNDVRPHEQAVTFWDGPVQPEQITPGSPEWYRFKLHNA